MKRRFVHSPVLSFVLFSRTRERTRARKSIAFLILIIIQRGKHHPSGFLFHRTRAFKRERYARKTREEQERLHHDLPNFDASLGNDVQANGLRNSGLGNREHYVYEFLSEYKVSTWVSFMARYVILFLSFRLKTELSALFLLLLFRAFVSTEREKFIFERQTLSSAFLARRRCTFFSQ